jgi:mannan polymerase II complex MNN10 subunit
MSRFWWLDLNTFIMEPSISLQQQLFNNLKANTYRDINTWNPKNITHPPDAPYLDKIARSPNADDNPDSLSFLLTQDCGGFNLGSFFMRRGATIDRMLDIWWDPVGYEQMHMSWEHNEQDALEAMYINNPWVRTKVGFVPQRKINSFPAVACQPVEGVTDHPEQVNPEYIDPRFHYNIKDRDFIVNMAGCEFGRDCWGEVYNFRELSNWLNRTRWERFKDWISDCWNSMWGKS